MLDPVDLSNKIRAVYAPCCLGRWPTPLAAAGALAAAVGRAQLFLKREDASASLYGGNKVRGLEFLLATARPGDVVFTIGPTGSTHCLATAAHARARNLRVALAQFPQAPSETGDAVAAATVPLADLLVRARSRVTFPLALARAWGGARALGVVRWIPAGGASARAVLGHVLAGLELAAQWPSAEPPDAVVTPWGTGGTAAGILVALQLLGWPSFVIAARVAPWPVARRGRILGLARRAAALLRPLGVSPEPRSSALVGIDQVGAGYGVPSLAGETARRVGASNNVRFDSTYGAKAFAAIGFLPSRYRRVVFWHTFATP